MKFYPSRRLLPLAAAGAALCFLPVFHEGALAAAAGANLVVAGLMIADLLASARVDPGSFAIDAPGEAGVGRSGRIRVRWVSPAEGFARAQMTIETSPAIEPESTFFEVIMPPRAEVAVETGFVARTRGGADVRVTRFRHRSRLGMWVLECEPPASARIDVVPDIADLRERGLAVPMIQRFETGFKRTARPDQEGEFDSLVKYSPGMDLRKVDWKASARNRKMLSRKFTLEQNHHVYLAFDCGRLMGTRTGGVTKMDWAMASALKLAFLALRTGDNVGLLGFDDDVRGFVRSGKGMGHFKTLAHRANLLSPSAEEANFNRAFRMFSRFQLRRSLLVVFTDFVDRVSATLLLEALTWVSRRHLVLFVACQDTELKIRLHAPLDDVQDMHERNEIFRLFNERKQVLREMQRMNISTIDADASSVTAPLLNRYLEIKAAQRL